MHHNLERPDQEAEHRRFFLFDELNQREVQDLHGQLELLFGSTAKNRLQNASIRSLFATLFTVFEGDFAAHQRIVGGLIQGAPPEAARVLRTLAFFRLYGDTPWVPSELLVRLARVDVGTSLDDVLAGFLDRVALKRGEGAASVWAVSHEVIAEDLLANLLTGETENE